MRHRFTDQAKHAQQNNCIGFRSVDTGSTVASRTHKFGGPQQIWSSTRGARALPVVGAWCGGAAQASRIPVSLACRPSVDGLCVPTCEQPRRDGAPCWHVRDAPQNAHNNLFSQHDSGRWASSNWHFGLFLGGCPGPLLELPFREIVAVCTSARSVDFGPRWRLDPTHVGGRGPRRSTLGPDSADARNNTPEVREFRVP